MKRGDTMGGIASRYHVSLRLLTDANPRVRGRALRVGQQIIVPTGGALSTSVARRVADPVVPAASSASGFHRVRRGETLIGLAAEYDVTVSQLRKWNGLGETEGIRAGQRLRIAPPGPPPCSDQHTQDQQRGRPNDTISHPRCAQGRNARGPGETVWCLGPGP